MTNEEAIWQFERAQKNMFAGPVFDAITFAIATLRQQEAVAALVEATGELLTQQSVFYQGRNYECRFCGMDAKDHEVYCCYWLTKQALAKFPEPKAGGE